MLKEFKDFIMKGNVIDLAVAVVLGGAFGAVVTALVEQIIMPIVSGAMAGVPVSEFVLKLGSIQLGIGALLNAIISFLIIALVLFLIVKTFNKLKKKEEVVEEVTTKTCPYCKTEIALDATRCPHCTSELN